MNWGEIQNLRQITQPKFSYFFAEVLRISKHEPIPVSSQEPPRSHADGSSLRGCSTKPTPVFLQQWNKTGKLASAKFSFGGSSSTSSQCCVWPQQQQPRVRCHTAFVCRLSTAHWGQVLFDGGRRQVALGMSEMCGVRGGIRNAIFLFWTRWQHLLQRRLSKVRNNLFYRAASHHSQVYKYTVFENRPKSLIQHWSYIVWTKVDLKSQK